MRTQLISLILLLIMTTVCFATVRTVSNHPLGGAQYSSLGAAYYASAYDDTLLLEGTDAIYFMPCGDIWAKKLVVIGIGFNPNKTFPKRTLISHTDPCTAFHLSIYASGTKFYGIEFTTILTLYGEVYNLVFEDCKFNDAISYGCGAVSFTFRNCVFDLNNAAAINYYGACGADAVSGTFSNCVFDGYIEGNGSALMSVAIDHCLFLSTTVSPFSNIRNAQIENSIFMNMFPDGTVNSNYENNPSRVAGTFPPDPGDGNTASGNIEEGDPDFVDCPDGTLYSSAHDYHLGAMSDALGTANDGTDIGVHGGFTGFSEEGEVLINPIMREMNILNSSVAPGGTLMVHIRATKPDND